MLTETTTQKNNDATMPNPSFESFNTGSAFLNWEVPELILSHFRKYIRRFRTITNRAHNRFRNRQWPELRDDSLSRFDLYPESMAALVVQVRALMGPQLHDKDMWREIKRNYSRAITLSLEFELAETFFNSLGRRVFGDVEDREELMFIFSEHEHILRRSGEPIYTTYAVDGQKLEAALRKLLLDYQPKGVPYENLEHDVEKLACRIRKEVLADYDQLPDVRIEMLKPPFYRNQAAYLIGRIYISGIVFPFILPMLHSEKGVYIDAFIADADQMSIIFSFTRSYFMVDVEIPSEFIRFLKVLLPHKSSSELYQSIGFVKHAKSELYRHLLRHLQKTSERFVIAPGIKGMVMSVFTLPSFDFVFKLIKDQFAPQKTTTHAKVKEAYRLVSRHDRAGRMVDTHEFEHFAFEKRRFEPNLLEELLAVAPSIVKLQGETVIIKHLFTERRMIPLNLYLLDAPAEAAQEVMLDYGQSIKDLASVNIFPGDMLLKNFGVTRHNRVIFYDYDEISLLTTCRFLYLPEARHEDEEFSDEPHFAPGKDDIYPEEFRRFLLGNWQTRQAFLEKHGDLFDVHYWRRTQESIKAGEFLTFSPYRPQYQLGRKTD